MRTIIFLIISINFLYSENRFFLDYKTENKIETVEITNNLYNQCQKDINLKRKYKEYDVLRCYVFNVEKTEKIEGLGTFTEIKQETKKEPLKSDILEGKKEVLEPRKEEQETNPIYEETEEEKEFNIPYISIIILIISVYFLYSNFRKLGKPIKEDKTRKKETLKENKKEKRSETHSIEEEPRKTTEKQRIKEEIKQFEEPIEILSHELIEIQRIEIWKQLKRDKTIKDKKPLYNKIKNLKEKTRKKEDLEYLSKLLHEIKKGVKNGRK